MSLDDNKPETINTWKEYLEWEIKNLQEALDEENKKIAMENKQ
jgi:hypothetical protein